MYKQFANKNFIMYLASGTVTFISEFASFAIMEKAFNLNVNMNHSLSFCIGIAISFSLNYLWVFKAEEYKMKIRFQLGLYLLLAILNLAITNLLIFYLIEAGLGPLIGKLSIMLLIVLWNFLIFRHIIFRQKTST